MTDNNPKYLKVLLSALVFIFMLAFSFAVFAETVNVTQFDLGNTAFAGYELDLGSIYRFDYAPGGDASYYRWTRFETAAAGSYTIDFLNPSERQFTIRAKLVSVNETINESEQRIQPGESFSITADLQEKTSYYLYIKLPILGSMVFSVNRNDDISLDTVSTNVHRSTKVKTYLNRSDVGQQMADAKTIEQDQLYAYHGDDRGDQSQWYSFFVSESGSYIVTLRSMSKNNCYYTMRIMGETSTIASTDREFINTADTLQIVCELKKNTKYYVYVNASHDDHDYTIAVCSSSHTDLQSTGKGKAPACTEDGYSETICLVCGQEGPNVVVPATGHVPSDETVIKEATCVEDGYSAVICTVCGEELSRTVLPATGIHIPGETTVVKEATCTEPGLSRIICTVCQQVLEETALPATGHTPGEERILEEADCQHPGMKGVVCEVCGEILSSEQTLIGVHTPGEWKVIKTPTCTEDGTRERTCAVCGAQMETETLPATGHTAADWTILQETTCVKDGMRAHVCEVCGETYDISIVPAPGHVFGKWEIRQMPTADAPGMQARVCEVCGEEETKEMVIQQP